MAEGCRFMCAFSVGACGDVVDGETDAGVPMCETHLHLVEDVGPVIERDADGAPVGADGDETSVEEVTEA